MKKIVLGAALFLLVNSIHAVAADHVSHNGQPHTERNILSTQLPTALIADIKQNYKEYWITELSEEGRDKHPDFSITLENADQIVHLHSGNSENWVIASTTVKM